MTAQRSAGLARLAVLAWAVWGLGLVLLVGGLVLGAIDDPVARWESVAAGFTQGAAFVAIGAVGLLLSVRRPGNAIGWIYLGSWVGMTAIVWIGSYAKWATVTHPGGFAGTPAVWLNNWLWVPVIGTLLTFPFLLFPNGHLLTRRWRPVAWAAGVVTVLWSIAFAFEGEDYSDALGRSADHPYTPDHWVGFFNTGKNVLALVFLTVLVGSVASLVLRFRRSGPLERAQIKWLMLAGALSVAFTTLPVDHGTGNWVDVVAGLVWALLPISVGVAILRYRLYDIDRFISRTTSYVLVIGVLFLVYVSVVTAVGQLLPKSSDLAVAAATLAAAALFRPVLSRVKSVVDRRFNRSRYDAQHTVDAFAARLRDGVDPDLVATDLLDVVEGTVEPTSASLWMRTP